MVTFVNLWRYCSGQGVDAAPLIVHGSSEQSDISVCQDQLDTVPATSETANRVSLRHSGAPAGLSPVGRTHEWQLSRVATKPFGVDLGVGVIAIMQVLACVSTSNYLSSSTLCAHLSTFISIVQNVYDSSTSSAYVCFYKNAD